MLSGKSLKRKKRNGGFGSSLRKRLAHHIIGTSFESWMKLLGLSLSTSQTLIEFWDLKHDMCMKHAIMILVQLMQG
jgi:hypothetical protein